ncbi:MAG TPA: translocation/assembly module TamB domain-containing protein [Vicinamibacterales bacterium]|nr:translocation/assembly module TamB domain-containing protein [Vicinamibacterales bacterium]
MEEDDSAAAPTPSRRRRRFRRLRILGGIICLIAVLSFVAVHTPPVRRFATQQVVNLLARERIEFGTDELGYNLFGASINLRNVRIRSTEWPDAPVFATIRRASFDLSLLQLLRGRYVLQTGSVDGLDIHYYVDEQGRDNLPRPPSDPNKPKEPLDYLIADLTVSNARVHYENRAQQVDAQLPVSSIKVTGNGLTDRHLIHLEAAGGNLQAQERRAAIDRVTGDVDLGDDDVTIQHLQVDTLGSRAEVTGTIAMFDAPVLDVALKTSVDAAKVAPLANVTDPVSGTIVIDATAKGAVATPAIDAHVTGSSLQFRELRDAQIDATAAYDVATRRADVSSLDVRGPWGAVTGSGNVALEGNGQSSVKANVNGLDAASIMRALRSPYITATRVDAKVQAQWPGLEFMKASGQADATLTATAARPSKNVMPVGGRLVARGTGEGVEAQLLKLVAPGAEIAGRVAVSRERALRGDVTARTGDLSQLVSSMEAFLGRPKGSLVPTTVTGAVDVNAKLAGTLDAPAAATTLNAPALTVGSAEGIALSAEANYTPAAVDIGRADLMWKDARAHADGRVGLQGTRPMNLSVSADQLDVPSILQTVNNGDLPVAGTISARGMVGGTLDRPMATLTAQGSNLVAYEEQIGSFNGNVTLQGRQVALSDFVVDKPQPEGAGRLSVSGTYHLDRKAYTVDLKSENLRLVGMMLPNGQSVRGNVKLAGHGEGTVASPAGTLDLDATDLLLNDMPIGNVVVKAMAADNQANITASADRYNVDANALIGLMRPFPATVKVQANGLDLSTLPIGPQPETVTAKADTTSAKPDTTAAKPDTTAAKPDTTAAKPDTTTAAKDEKPITDVNQPVEIKQTRREGDQAPATEVRVTPPDDTKKPDTTKPDTTKPDAEVGLKGDATESAQPRVAGLEGQVHATIEASGNLTELEAGKATIALQELDARWRGRPFKVTSPSPIQYADKRVTVDKLQVSAEGAALTIGGQLPLTDQAGDGEIDVDLKGNLATIAKFAPPDTNIDADGTIAMTGSIKGTMKRIDPDLTITVENGLVISPLLEPGFSRIELMARIAEGQALVEKLTASWGTATIEASGRVPFEVLPQLPVEIPRMNGAATLMAALKGLDPSSLPGAPPQLSGMIGLVAEVSAKQPNLASLEGKITFEQLEVAYRSLDLAQKQPSTIGIASGTATVEQLDLAGSAGEIKAGGRVELAGNRAMDLTVDGNLNVAAISVVTERLQAEGESKLNVRAQGTFNDPQVTGSLELVNANFVTDEPNLAAENLNAHVDLQGRRIVLTKLEADLNGGTLNASGDLTLGEGAVSDINLRVTTKDFAYDAPLDMRSISDADIQITRQDENFVVAGKVTIDEAGLTGDVNFDQGLLAAMTARKKLDLTEERNPFLERVRFNVDVDTATPILVDNNLAKAEIESDIRVVGTPYEPGLLGEIRLLEGSEIRLNERRYEAEPSTITFVDERRIFPSFDLHLNTTAGNYEVTIAVTGTPGDTETTMTSTPSLPEPDIMALLVTGRTLDQMRGEEYEVAREQVLSYLTGRVGSQLGRGIQEATGLSEVRVEPTLIANEADPGARLTVGQELTEELKLVYSTNLTDSNDQIWVAEYDVTRRFQTQAVRQEDNSYRLDFRHDVRFGGQPEPRRIQRAQAEVERVMMSESDAPNSAELLKKFGVKEGDNYDFFKIRNGVERVEESLMEQGYLQSRVRLERKVESQRADLTLKVMRGPMVDIQFMGATPPQKVQEQVKTQWHRGVFDKQRGDDGIDRLREWLMGDNYLQPKITYEVQGAGDDRRRVVFQIEPGMRSEKIVLAFEGASRIHPRVLDKIVEQQKMERKLFTDPLVVTELLQRFYREQGYLVTEIDAPKYEYTGGLARVVFVVREGPRFTVRRVTASGTKVYQPDAVVAQLPVVPGETFLPLAAENALDKIRDLYWRRGYNDVRSDYSLVIDRAAGQVDIAFDVKEGRQSIVGEVRIAGNSRVSDHLVSEQIQLMPGQPLDLSALARSRRNLYDTGAFSVVDITRRERRGLADDPTNPAPDQRPMDVTVNIREVQPFQIRYGASYDTERGVGGIFDISNRNSLGGAREIGLRSRYDKQLHEGRVYLNQPALKYLPKTMGSIYFREELNPPTEITDPFDFNRKGFSVESEHRLHNAYVLSYGYRLERAHTLTPLGNGTVLDEALTVAPVTSTLTRESRDEVLDASRGAFLSQSFSYSPSWLGADSAYIKYLGQYFRYIALEPAKRKAFTNEILRPRLVYAVGGRIGLARGFGDIVPRSERFFAGGSQTMRGFGQNAVGPIGPDRIPIGGEAMLVINNELRVPLISIFDGVVFADIGNVFERVRDFSFTDIRKSGGVGLRVRTPWVLLRADYGIVIDQRPGEPRSRIYVSIGQAF